jgi:ABC-2 type transport system ATP-binding protein
MENIISCMGLGKCIGNFKLEDISFQLEPGYILGVIGRNGSGKTTLLRSLMGSYKLDKGDVVMAGRSISGDTKEYKEQMAYVLNESPFETTITAEETGRLYGRYYKTFDIDRYIELLSEFDIPLNLAIGAMSKGQQIKLQLAFALSYDAKVYFLDEPTGNLDVEFRDTFYRYIREMVSDGTRSVIYATHLVEEMEEFADYILWLEQEEQVGRVKYMGSMEDLRSGYRMVEADDTIINLIPEGLIVGDRKRETHKEVLIRVDNGECPKEIQPIWRYPDLKEIMYYVEKAKE